MVTEARGSMRNILLGYPGVQMIIGKHRTVACWNMPKASRARFLVGFSAAGTPGCPKSYVHRSGHDATTVNDNLMSEGCLNTLLAAEHGVPALMNPVATSGAQMLRNMPRAPEVSWSRPQSTDTLPDAPTQR